MPKISLIVAYEQNRGIGKDGQLPWRLPSDLAYFKKVTMGCPIIMGRKTYESIGRPLPGRLNVVVSRNAEQLHIEGVETATSIKQALELASDVHKTSGQPPKEIFIIGGGEIFKLSMDLADRIYATEIHQAAGSDVHFPEINSGIWQESSRDPQPEENGFNFDFVVYDRR